MQARARIKYLRMSPKKMRRVADLIKGKPVEEAMNILNYTPKAAAHHLAKTLKAAASNAISTVGTAKLKAEDLSVSRVYVDSAPTAKRVRFQSMGRVFRIRQRYCHLTIEVEGEPEADTPTKKVRPKRVKTEKDVAGDKSKKAALKKPKKAVAKKDTKAKKEEAVPKKASKIKAADSPGPKAEGKPEKKISKKKKLEE